MIPHLQLFALFTCAPLLHAATLEGFVCDSTGAVIPGATVRITEGSGSAFLKTISTGARGHFSISSLPAASYTLHLEMKRIGEASLGPLVIGGNDKKRADLVLTPAIDFFDEPKFTVAGVTQNGYAGGHGSDTVTRSAEALTKATASLSRKASSSSDLLQADQHHSAAVAKEAEGHAVE